jgi:hypothetical protein
MPAYSTWHPADGRSQPTPSAAQAAQRRPHRRDDPVRGDHMVFTLLGEIGDSMTAVSGVRSNPIRGSRRFVSARLSGFDHT